MRKTTTAKLVALPFLMALASGAIAGPYADAFGKCLSDSTTGRDRTDLVRWIVTVIANHPDAADITAVTPAQHEAMDRRIGALVTRLFTEDCPKEAKAATEKEGPESMRAGFTSLGQIAMQEVTANPAVKAGFTSFAKYADVKKIQAVVGPTSQPVPAQK